MPKLNCTVTNCNMYSTGYCMFDSIQVAGGENKENTCCSNFYNAPAFANNINSFADQARGPVSSLTEVQCLAHDCAYCSGNNCVAQELTIGCNTVATNFAHETKCESYKHK